MRVLIIDTTDTVFTADSVGEKALGGIETATVELSRRLAALGHEVTVANQVTEPVMAGGVSWRPRPTVRELQADVVIVNNDPRLFDEAPPPFVVERAGLCGCTTVCVSNGASARGTCAVSSVTGPRSCFWGPSMRVIPAGFIPSAVVPAFRWACRMTSCPALR